MINNWDQLRCQAAISTLQGLQEGAKITQLLEIDPPLLAKTAVTIGNALIEELQKDEACKLSHGDEIKIVDTPFRFSVFTLDIQKTEEDK